MTFLGFLAIVFVNAGVLHLAYRAGLKKGAALATEHIIRKCPSVSIEKEAAAALQGASSILAVGHWTMSGDGMKVVFDRAVSRTERVGGVMVTSDDKGITKVERRGEV